MGEGPPVLSLIEAMTRPRAAILVGLREAALSLPGVEERTVYDGFSREWTPAYYEGVRQLFHVHNFRAALRATMFVGIRTLKPFLLDSDRLTPELLQLVASGSGTRGTMQLKVPLDGCTNPCEMSHPSWSWCVVNGSMHRPEKATSRLVAAVATPHSIKSGLRPNRRASAWHFRWKVELPLGEGIWLNEYGNPF